MRGARFASSEELAHERITVHLLEQLQLLIKPRQNCDTKLIPGVLCLAPMWRHVRDLVAVCTHIREIGVNHMKMRSNPGVEVFAQTASSPDGATADLKSAAPSQFLSAKNRRKFLKGGMFAIGATAFGAGLSP